MRTIVWYVAKKAAEKKGAKKAGTTAETAPEFTADVKKAALREDGLPIVHHTEIRGDDDGTD